ncbi:hypothetical protein [Cohnella candidum]|uniref:hypothetical protein n=1 Tax=Cohnella candidum TaxID=2674991 RepID=UPI0013DE3C8F|nr:hypothetical protein [Cohnella candidum]
MDDAAYLVVSLAGLFALIGVVIAGVARLVQRDTTEYDRRFLWQDYEKEKEE